MVMIGPRQLDVSGEIEWQCFRDEVFFSHRSHKKSFTKQVKLFRGVSFIIAFGHPRTGVIVHTRIIHLTTQNMWRCM